MGLIPDRLQEQFCTSGVTEQVYHLRKTCFYHIFPCLYDVILHDLLSIGQNNGLIAFQFLPLHEVTVNQPQSH